MPLLNNKEVQLLHGKPTKQRIATYLIGLYARERSLVPMREEMEEKHSKKTVIFWRFWADVVLHEESSVVVQQQTTNSTSLAYTSALVCTQRALIGSSFYKMASFAT